MKFIILSFVRAPASTRRSMYFGMAPVKVYNARMSSAEYPGLYVSIISWSTEGAKGGLLNVTRWNTINFLTSHIYWDHQDLLIFPEILSINKITLAYSIRIFLAEQIQRLVRFIAGGLYFDGTYLLISGEQKIYFIEMSVIIGKGMIEELVPGSGQHLGNQILANIAQIG